MEWSLPEAGSWSVLFNLTKKQNPASMILPNERQEQDSLPSVFLSYLYLCTKLELLEISRIYKLSGDLPLGCI